MSNDEIAQVAAHAVGLIVGRLLKLAIIVLGCIGLITVASVGMAASQERVKVEAKAKPVHHAKKKVKHKHKKRLTCVCQHGK